MLSTYTKHVKAKALTAQPQPQPQPHTARTPLPHLHRLLHPHHLQNPCFPHHSHSHSQNQIHTLHETYPASLRASARGRSIVRGRGGAFFSSSLFYLVSCCFFFRFVLFCCLVVLLGVVTGVWCRGFVLTVLCRRMGKSVHCAWVGAFDIVFQCDMYVVAPL
jgi:hypothetical protein